MAIKRHVTITCDGPCGTVLNASKIPNDWNWIVFEPVRYEKGVHIPSGRRKRAVTCPRCTIVAEERLKQFAFQEPEVSEEKET